MHQDIMVSPGKRDSTSIDFAVEESSRPSWGGAPLGSIIINVITEVAGGRKRVDGDIAENPCYKQKVLRDLWQQSLAGPGYEHK